MARLAFILRRGGVSLLLTAVAAAVAVAAPGHAPSPQLRLTAASGALSLSNSHAGAAILSAPAMRPGATTTGTATIGASAAARLAVSARVESEAPGTGGGRLSSQLQLVVVDTARGAVVYRGSPARLANAFAGTLGAGQRRTYRFTVTLPGSAGNAVQGARLRLSFVWTGVGTAPVAPPTPAPPAPPAPPAQPAPPVITLPAACATHGRLVVRLHAPAGTSIRRVDVKVGRARAKRYRPREALSLRVRGRARVKVSVRLSDGRRVSASRGYRC